RRTTARAAEASRRDSWLRPPDRKGFDVGVRRGRVERLFYYREPLRRHLRRLEADLLHQTRGIGCEIDLPRDPRVIDVARDLPPALHLSHDPDSERFPRERREIDALGIAAHLAEPVGISARQHLFD